MTTTTNECPPSFSSFLFRQFSKFTDGNVSFETKMETSSFWEPFFGDDDAYITFSGESHQAHLPALTNWNGNSGLRKGYTLLMWIRPRLDSSWNETDNNVDDDLSFSVDDGNVKEVPKEPEQRILYRFSSSADDSTGTGICVVCSQWKAVPLDDEYNRSSTENNDDDGTLHKSAPRLQLETILTAFTLPHYKPNQIPQYAARTSYVQQPLILEENKWQLLGFSHSHPYLKPSIWSVTVNGRLVGSDELPYPVLPENHHVDNMEYCSMFQNITSSGAILTRLPGATHEKPDYHKTASQLQAESMHSMKKHSTTSRFHEIVPLNMDVAAIALYADRSIPLACLAVAADAGPTMALQNFGRILPTLPPVPNWTKGASLEGPKVGIPLAVHSSALGLQQLSSAPNLVFCCSGSSARLLGGLTIMSTRLVCSMHLQPGSTINTPRVGLIQPATPLRIAEDELPCLYVVGNVKLYHSVQQCLLQVTGDVGEKLSSNISAVTNNLSVALLEQEILTNLMQPFFLALCPPGKLFDRHKGLYVESLKHLYHLYSADGVYAAKLINLFTTLIRSGGGRAHEEVLQSGLLHVFASSLRLSLLRATRLKMFQDQNTLSDDDFVRRIQKLFPDETSIAPPQHASRTSPSFIPAPITRACRGLIDACCGPPQIFLENLSPQYQIRRTSDLALTAIFGLALDMDLWGGYPKAASEIFGCVAERYGGVCVTAGYVMRSQVSVQHYLDMIRLRIEDTTYSQAAPASQDLEATALPLSRLLQAMLLSSLSNMRSISQGENDISACVGALCDCPLGTVAAHLILNAIVGVLVWCDVLPVECALASSDAKALESVQDQDKMQVASRLGRNILMAQFHDVIAPMILSRTVFSGERITISSSMKISNQQTLPLETSCRGDICWQKHWRLSLLLFSWVASIAGPEGIIAAKTCGNLLLASSHAGSLQGALEKSDKVFISTIFLPSPTMSLLIGSTLRNEWSYTDLLSDRLEIMMPLLPGLIVALLSNLPKSLACADKLLEVTATLTVLSEILTAVGGSFHRVFGGVIHLENSQSNAGLQSTYGNKPGKLSVAIKAAKSYVPSLVTVSLVLENQLLIHKSTPKNDDTVQIMQCRPNDEGAKSGTNVETWIDVASASSETLMNEIAVNLLEDETINGEMLVSLLQSCQRSVLNTAAGLVSHAMYVGGTGAAAPLLQSLLTAVQNSLGYVGKSEVDDESSDNDSRTTSTSRISSKSGTSNIAAEPLVMDSPSTGEKWLHNSSTRVAQTVLCRLVSLVICKALKQTRPRDVWGYELSSSITRTITFVEETELLAKSKTNGSLAKRQELNDEQIVLVCVILELLSYGRDATGWCQFVPPSMALSSIDVDGGSLRKETVTAASKLLLPLLQSSLRIMLLCLECICSSSEVLILQGDAPKKESLLGRVVAELNLTLTAAVVGLVFPSARETALNAMACLRRVINIHETSKDEVGAELCKSLLVKIAEELRVRYESERRLRETALFDAYEAVDDDLARKEAAEGSQAVERLILGDNGFRSKSSDIESIVFSQDGAEPDAREIGVSEDFVLFHDPKFSNQTLSFDGGSKLGFEFLRGFGSALDSWKTVGEGSTELLSVLNPFLEAWDAAVAREAADSEAIKLFEVHLIGESASPSRAFESSKLPVAGSESAADAMSTFFEFAATEKNRLKEISIRFLPSYRYSRMAFAERFCWSRHMEGYLNMDEIWERGIADGNRDIRSRIPTVPCFPQFRRYLPRYMDHGSDADTREGVVEVADLRVPKTSLDLGASGNLLLEGHLSTDFGALTKTLLETGHLEIVDITKKQIDEDEEPDLALPEPSMDVIDEEETALFPVVRIDHEPKQDGEHLTSKEENVKVEADATKAEMKPEENRVHDDELAMFPTELIGKGQHNITTSSFSTPPDNASSSLSLLHSAASGLIEQHVENCVHVKAEGNRHCTMLLTASHLILEYDGNPEGFFEGEILALQEEAERQRMNEDFGSCKEKDPDEIIEQKIDGRHRQLAALRAKSIRWNLTEVSHIYLRRYRLRDTALEIFFIPTGSTSFGGYGIFSPSSSIYIDFGPGYSGVARRDEAAFAIMRRSPSQAIKQWPDRSEQFLHEQLNRLTIGWVEGRITNFDYLLHLNMLSGRSYNDICQYPVFPWVLADYTSEEIPDLSDRNSYRDLTKPVGALNPDRLKDFLDRFNTFADPSIPPFMYGSHYSTSAGVVLHFLVRLHPYAGLHRQLQGGYFDVADRLFSSVPRTWSMCTGSSAAEVKELTPEWYCNPAFLRNTNKFKLGTSQDGEIIDDVTLPPWAKGSSEKFVEVMRAALESDICSEMLSSWIDLIFGRKQQGPAAIEANNVFFYLTYYGTVDVASIEDEALRLATELQIAHFGQCPMQLFKRNHVRRLNRGYHHLSLYQVLSLYSQRHEDPNKRAPATSDGKLAISDRSRLHSIFGEPWFLPFLSAPLSHWVHLDAPPPGPHAPMIAVRFAGVDRCLVVDAKGVFHSFRWAWRSDELPGDQFSMSHGYFDLGCFIAQRELPRFRSVPRLMYTPHDSHAVVAISKTLFAGRTVLLVLSDGDGCGSLGMQLVDPAKGEIRGEVMVPQIHSAPITCITTDPIGSAAGHGGVGGELALVGSADGIASLWRFMSSHYLPLRPRVKLRGHHGQKISAVALCSSLHIAATLSSHRCCLYSIGNGALIRVFGPPVNALDMQSSTDCLISTRFADSAALALSVQGFIVTVCETTIKSGENNERVVITLHLFTVEGISLGSKPLESWRGVPHKMHCSPDGTAVMVCCGRGVTMHRLSACQPLEFLDEFQITDSDGLGTEKVLPSAWDIDLGPTLNRPVVAAAACSNGVLRLHALPGISAWSERHKKVGLNLNVGGALAKPALRIKDAVRDGLGFGRQIAGIGRDLTQEMTTDVKERGVSGFLGSMFRKNSSSK